MQFKLSFGCDNAAFEDWGAGYETARILREVADKVSSGDTEGNAFDVNGNRVGSWRFTAPE